MFWAARVLHWAAKRVFPALRSVGKLECRPCLGLTVAIVGHERGMPRKRSSSDCVDYVPALCTHRPSLLPIGRVGEKGGASLQGEVNLFEPARLEEEKVVTRFP